MTTLQVVPSTVFQKLALMNASPELRDALEGILPLARKERDGLISEMIIGDDISIGQRLLNRHLLRKAAEWNDRIYAAESALDLSRKSTR